MNGWQPNIQSGEGATSEREHNILRRSEGVQLEALRKIFYEFGSDISEADALNRLAPLQYALAIAAGI
jgi:hypothetical protein